MVKGEEAELIVAVESGDGNSWRLLDRLDRVEAWVTRKEGYFRPNLLHTGSLRWHIYFFFCFLGGVIGLPVVMPP